MTPTIDLDDLGDVERHLKVAADELQDQWSKALSRGDFATIDRVVETSQAVHRALAALQADTLVPSG